jgi:hypothetical protein
MFLRAWHGSVGWPWFGGFLLGAVGMLSIGEYALAIALLVLSAVSISSRILHSSATPWLKGLGLIIVLVGWSFSLIVGIALKEERPWTNAVVAWNKYIVVSALPNAVRWPPKPSLLMDTMPGINHKRDAKRIYPDVLFKDATEFTPQIRNQIVGHINEIAQYLLRLRIELPDKIPPIETNESVSSGSFYGGKPPYFSSLNIPQGHLVDRSLQTLGFCQWVLYMFVYKNIPQMMPGYEYDSLNRFSLSSTSASYLNASYWRTLEQPSAFPDVRALWELRTIFGADYVDRMVAFTVIDARESEPQRDNPNDPMQKLPGVYLLRHMMQGNAVLDNSGNKFKVINTTLEKYRVVP